MKQTILPISILFSLIVFSSCQKQQENTATTEVKRAQSILTATLEGGKETRTGLDNPENGVYYPHWQETDEIAVYGRNGKQADKFLLHTGAGTATATFAGPEPGDNPVGLYPYSDITEEGLNDNVLTLELPAVQEYSYRSFGDGAYPMLAVSQSGDLEFKNLCSVLIIPLTGTTAPVESIRFIAHDDNTPVCGKATVRTDFDTEPELVMKEGESRAVTLQCGGVYLLRDVPTYFFLVIPPGTYKGGFDLKIISSAGSLTRSVNTDVTFRRSKYRSISTIDFIPEEPYTPVPDIVDLGLSVPWASCNLGALRSDEEGYYYAWGETQKKESYSWSNYAFGSSSSSLNKYTSSDGKSILEQEDDAAAVQLGDKWRIPTEAEFQELLEKCSWTWKESRYSYLVTGPNGNSIYIPAAASSEGTDGYGSTEFGWYWSSCLNVEDGKNRPYYLYFSEAFSGPALYGNGYRPTGASIRPVYGNPPIHASSVSLDHTELELTIGEQVQLKATVLPENTSVKLVSWFSSDNSIASVSTDGLVTGTGDGTATITVKTVDGGKTADCRVTVRSGETDSPSIVDMGLSVGWASFNLGASKPEEPGYHFAWGELSEKAFYEWSTYRWCNGTEKSLTKYNNLAEYGYNGFVDNLMELDPEDDAAQVYLGQKWRMPTWDEWIELCDNTTWTWTTVGDMGGYKVVSTINGNSLFFPAAGYGPYSQYPSAIGEAACYWSNTIVDFQPSSAYAIYFDTERKPWPRADYEGREGRYSIRPVFGDSAFTPSISLDHSELELSVGGRKKLIATVLPESASDSDKEVHWSSSDRSVAIIDYDGIVCGLSEGTAIITATAFNGRREATCRVTVENKTIGVPEAVDLGLSVQWSTFNLGAAAPEDDGLYYAWGETTPNAFVSSSNYKWYSYQDRTYLKYNWIEGSGTVDYKYYLDLEDDAAHYNLNGDWRMPTAFEQMELMYHCEWTYVKNYQGSGISGCIVHGATEETCDNTIFIPSGSYQSSTLEFSKSYIQGPYAQNGMVTGDDAMEYGDYCYSACAMHRLSSFLIRPVSGPRVAWSAIPGDLEFGNVPVGSTATKPLIVKNTGESTIEMNVEARDPFSMDVYSVTLAPGESQTINVSFSPTEKRDYKGSTSIAVRGMGRPWINIFGTGI